MQYCIGQLNFNKELERLYVGHRLLVLHKGFFKVESQPMGPNFLQLSFVDFLFFFLRAVIYKSA